MYNLSWRTNKAIRHNAGKLLDKLGVKRKARGGVHNDGKTGIATGASEKGKARSTSIYLAKSVVRKLTSKLKGVYEVGSWDLGA